MTRIKVQAIVCDSCGNQTFEESEITSVTVAGPDSDINGKYDLCLDCREPLSKLIGMGADKGKRPNFKVFNKPRGGHAPGTKLKAWTDEDVQFIIDHHEQMDYNQLGEKLGRTYGSIYQRVKKLSKEGRLELTDDEKSRPEKPKQDVIQPELQDA
jgi:hypothetical protein